MGNRPAFIHLLGALILAFVVATLASASAFAKDKTGGLLKTDDGESVSKLIRSHAGHFWSFAKQSNESLGRFGKYQGLVTGDPHFGNFSVIAVRDNYGRRKLRFVDIDFDDAGIGSFAFDFARFIITVKAVGPDVKVKDMVDAYIDGLNGKKTDQPKRIREALELSMKKFEKKKGRYVAKKTEEKFSDGSSSGDKFAIKPGKIAPYRGPYSRAQIKALFPGVRVLDIATRLEDGGGSADAVRIWVLTETADGDRQIQEIKGYEPTSLLQWGPQPLPEILVNEVHREFWSELDGSIYDLKKLGPDLVWVREKKIPLIDIPYQLSTKGDRNFVDDLSVYDANYLGLLHGRQTSARDYVRALEADPDGFRAVLKTFAKKYLAVAPNQIRCEALFH